MTTFGFLLGCILFFGTANASPVLLLDSSGLLIGAKAVIVNDKQYDVVFGEGTCAEVFGGCDEANFAFTSQSEALAASKALIDTVFLDVPGLGDFDSNPMLTRGCFIPFNCWALTPYQVLGDNFLVAQALNSGAGFGTDGYFIHTPGGPGIPMSNYDSSDDINGILARWSVPEPASLVLLGIGCVGLMTANRRQRKKQE